MCYLCAIYIYVYIYIYVCVCMCVYMCVCVYIWISISPDNSELLTTFGLLQLQLGETGKAFSSFGTALTENPRDTKVFINLDTS